MARAFSEFVRQGLSVAAQKGAWGAASTPSGHPSVDQIGAGLSHVEPRPALSLPVCCLFARIVQEPLPDVHPNHVSAVQTDHIRGLDLNTHELARSRMTVQPNDVSVLGDCGNRSGR